MTRGTSVRTAAPRAAKLSEADLKRTCTELLQWDGWRCLHLETVYDARRGRGFGEVGMPDSLYVRYETIRLCGQCGINCHDFAICFQCEVAPVVKPWRSQVLWVEWKSKSGRVKRHQFAWHIAERLRGALTLMAGLDFEASIEGFREFYKTSGLMRRSI